MIREKLVFDENVNYKIFSSFKLFLKICKEREFKAYSVYDIKQNRGYNKNQSFPDELVYKESSNNILVSQDLKQTINKEEMSLFLENNVIVFFFDKNNLTDCALMNILTWNWETMKKLCLSNIPQNYYYPASRGKFEEI
jgi:hypothetical protein